MYAGLSDRLRKPRDSRGVSTDDSQPDPAWESIEGMESSLLGGLLRESDLPPPLASTELVEGVRNRGLMVSALLYRLVLLPAPAE